MAWLFACCAFVAAYLLVPTAPPPSATDERGRLPIEREEPSTPERVPAAGGGGQELARPLLEGGQPAPALAPPPRSATTSGL